MRRHLTFANVVACLALFVALGGSALAAKSLIDGASIRRNSIPANRIKKGSIGNRQVKANSLTGAKIKAATLAKVPAAAHADSADFSARAGSADSSTRAAAAASADSATTLAGLGPGAFARAEQVRAGVADSGTLPPKLILTLPRIGVAIETNPESSDPSVIVRNLEAVVLGLPMPAGITTVAAGATRQINVETDPWAAGEREAVTLLQRADGRTAIVRCYLPDGGLGNILAFCEASVFP